MKIKKKDVQKKGWSLLLALLLTLGLMPLTTQPAYGAVVTGVTIVTNNGQQDLDDMYPYLVNGVKRDTGTLGSGGCTAYFDASTGTLTLQDHTSGRITANDLAVDLDFTLKLIGANTVNGEVRNLSFGGDITITADSPASLQITNKESSTVNVYGIYTHYPTNSGDATITIGGKAQVTIDVENTHASDGNCFGICARTGVFIVEEASVSVTAISQNAASTFPVAYGIYSESAGLTFNTGGNISVDCASGSPATQKHCALRGNSYTLTGLNKMTLKWGAAGYECAGTLTPPAQYAYNKGKLGGVNCSVTQAGAGPVRALTIISGKNDFGRESGQYFAGDTVNLTAKTIAGLTFKNWQATGGSFGDANSASTTYTMPATDATVTAAYHFFTAPPTFTKTGTDKGDISFQLSAEPQQAPRLVATTGDETNIVGGQYFRQTADPQSKTVQNGTGAYAVPDGNYRIAAQYNNIWRFSDVFAVDYSGGTVSVTSMSVKTPPTKTTYTAGETLDLAGLAVTLNKSDGSNEDVAFADFSTKGITALPAQGTSLATTNTTVTLTHTVSGKNANQPITVNPPAVSVTSVSVTPKTVSVRKGTTQSFSATVAGTGAFDNTVNWSVTGGGAGTAITTTGGVLTIDAAETATTVTVTATANGDSSKTDTATVTVTDKKVPVINVNPITVTYTGTPVANSTITGTAMDGSTAVAGTWSFTGSVPTNVGTHTLSVTFTPSDSTTYAVAGGSLVLTIQRDTSTGSSSGSGGGGSSDDRPATPKPIAVEIAKDIQNGVITVDPNEAKPGDTVTVTVKPKDGYELRSIGITDKNGKEIEVTKRTDDTFSFKMPDTAVTIQAEFAPRSAPPIVVDYTDVKPENWFYSSVLYVVKNKLMIGTSPSKFSPNMETSRAMIVTILYHVDGSPEMTSSSNFSDVGTDTWYADAVAWATKNNVVSGFPDGSFKPNSPLTREQLVTILYNFAKIKGYDTSGTELTAFGDADQISSYALPAMQWAIKHGIISGMGENQISPATTATRAQMAVILQHYIEDFVR